MIIHRRTAKVCWPAAFAVFVASVALPDDDFSSWLARLIALLLLAPVTVPRFPPLWQAAKELVRAVDVGELAVAAALAPLVGVVLNTWIGADPPGTTFYETTAQVGAGLLVAYAVEGGRRMSRDPDLRSARAVHVGLAAGVIVALGASLIAVARADGSWFLFAMTLGGLTCGALFVIAATVPLGAVGENGVVGTGEDAKRDRVRAGS